MQHQVAERREGLSHTSGQIKHDGDPGNGTGHVQVEDRGRGEGRRRQVLVPGDERVRNVTLHRRRHHLG